MTLPGLLTKLIDKRTAHRLNIVPFAATRFPALVDDLEHSAADRLIVHQFGNAIRHTSGRFIPGNWQLWDIRDLGEARVVEQITRLTR